MTANGYRAAIRGGDDLRLDSDDGCTTVQKPLERGVYFKRVNFMVHGLYLNKKNYMRKKCFPK